jgi:peptidoglycan hydrolase-like protein with peptidoglycan-binding domain
VVDPATWPALVITVRRPDTGAAVRAAQVQLDRWGYELAVDGIFGTGTEAAVQDAQRQNALVIDGVVGPATWRALTGGAGA